MLGATVNVGQLIALGLQLFSCVESLKSACKQPTTEPAHRLSRSRNSVGSGRRGMTALRRRCGPILVPVRLAGPVLKSFSHGSTIR